MVTPPPTPADVPTPSPPHLPASSPSPTRPAAPPTPTPNTAAEEQAILDYLTHLVLPERDDLALAMAYNGLAEAPAATPPLAQIPLAIGTQQTFQVLNHDTNTVSEIEAQLQWVSQHAYFWFDTGPGSVHPDEDELRAAGESFDVAYATNVAIFGAEDNPGIDGDPRVHVVNASPLVLCDVTVFTASFCGIAGYFSSFDVLPAAVQSQSNEREMFVMNVDYWDTSYYASILAHEFRHMIEDRYDPNDADWEVEGSAVLAEVLNGYTSDAWWRANQFLSDPDQQLNHWSAEASDSYYGQGYLFNHYLYNRLGADLYRAFATSPADGLLALDQVATANGQSWRGHSLWLDWLAALALHDHPQAPAAYRLEGLEVDTVAMTQVEEWPAVFEATVHQYAADIYELSGRDTVTLTFQGSPEVSLLDARPVSGDWMWWSGRANYSNPRLTRSLDLRGVAEATLTYHVYQDIEQGYDFAYVSLSADGGRTWQGLAAERMQGERPEDDPSDVALTERFYSDRDQEWQEERIDLSPFVGREVLLRFEVVTDPILTYGGLALDDVAVPEIGFYDDVETDGGGWTAEGFSRVPAAIPQLWYLQLITFADGRPLVTPLALNDDQTLSLPIALADSGGRAVLVVAAAAPMTLVEAHYRLEIGR